MPFVVRIEHDGDVWEVRRVSATSAIARRDDGERIADLETAIELMDAVCSDGVLMADPPEGWDRRKASGWAALWRVVPPVEAVRVVRVEDRA